MTQAATGASAPPSTAPGLQRDPRFALGQSIGLTAFVWGYPLVETMRTCRLQTVPRSQGKAAWAAQIDRIQHSRNPTVASDRDIVTPANDLLYTTGWINLACGPRSLQVPASRRHGGRYFVLALYDAWTNNFANPGLRTSDPDGESVLLLGPGATAPAPLPAGTRLIHCPSNLVWMIARVVVGGDDDKEQARALQSDIALACARGTDLGQLPTAVHDWQGEPVDTMAALAQNPADIDAIAGRFFHNLCQCLASAPPPAEDGGMLAWFARAKLVAGAHFDWNWLDAPLREGLCQGLQDGAALLIANSRSHVARPWATSFAMGSYGSNFLTRALVAYKGLGGLVSDEAVYAMGDFDADKHPLDGRNEYLLRFEPGDLPPVDAFWSVTLYDADRFLYDNPAARYAIGDRTAGLLHDPDGGLSLQIRHRPPADQSNWLPAPGGSFYLILRMYCPRPDARNWRIPPVRRRSSNTDAGPT